MSDREDVNTYLERHLMEARLMTLNHHVREAEKHTEKAKAHMQRALKIMRKWTKEGTTHD